MGLTRKQQIMNEPYFDDFYEFGELDDDDDEVEEEEEDDDGFGAFANQKVFLSPFHLFPIPLFIFFLFLFFIFTLH